LNVGGIVEGRRVAIVGAPHALQPLAGQDRIGRHQDTGEEAVEFGEQHRLGER
jgi:hypothetical protein